ncbi:hypothetical protein BBJ29_008202 [Phytophthora kernoviae]|uniref:EF-hand domain-containing protein n=1 Tax=Phytophthora kernoviae TaxID=325452 RepID=A0A3F2RXY6_9STRA|nr:hypothetical protein BBJ29_008202 [Phytophthora kernoviae]RLN66439.1 hypothetical protein BBP00_00002199 [Phytophthora kernoviae]
MTTRLLLRSSRSVAALAVTGCLSTLSLPRSAHSEGAAVDEKPTFSERTVGNYENRLRKFSSPERVFEYFSSVEIDKQFFMTRDDLARAITPFTYRHGAPLSSKNPKFNAKASGDKCPKEVADEYLKRVQTLMLETQNVTKEDVKTLLTFKEEQHVDFETHVKALHALQITNSEFDQFIVMHGGPPRPKTFFDMVDADGDGLISYPEYMFFNTLLAIPERQFELAFKMFDMDDNDKLDHREFKQIMDLMRLRTPAGRQDRSLHDDDGHITEQEFLNFSVFLEHLDELKVAIDLVMQDREQFQRATKAALRGSKNTKSVTPLQIDILFALFDEDGDGHLSPKEFIEVMQKRKDGGFNEPRDTGVFEFINHIKECIQCLL